MDHKETDIFIQKKRRFSIYNIFAAVVILAIGNIFLIKSIASGSKFDIGLYCFISGIAIGWLANACGDMKWLKVIDAIFSEKNRQK